MDDLISLANELGLTVVERAGRKLGGYNASTMSIRLDPGMTRRTARSVLAHEIAHHIFGDVPAAHGPVRARQERRANEWAALYLIQLEAFMEAERLRDGHTASMAFDLNVTAELVEAFRRVVLRERDTAASV
ncbi:ImmA/IrrE family metallo-endopeptidase [Microbacterium lacus]|uniref:ImmA/IrrE family metallo-endopeptidase n=1 Tax=Microbacterium lacus TaxID=415217 RepID=UPI000C2BDFE5|nr:ImmA/IrrE family metallo-endopeptidase [Microbacterium lacus]